MKLKMKMKKRNPDCTTCLWEYICDWNREDCRYVPERGADNDERHIDQIHGR